MAGGYRAAAQHDRTPHRAPTHDAADLRQARRQLHRRRLSRWREPRSSLVSELGRRSRGRCPGAGGSLRGTGENGDRRRTGGAVARHGGELAGLRRLPDQDQARDPRRRARARLTAILSQPSDTGPDWSGRELHFVGIGGAGMSGLALIAKMLGAAVTGSDRAESSYMARLREVGIEPVIGHASANVPAGAEVVYSSAIPADNPERRAARRELHRADLLAEIAALRRCLAVTGTHGKTTTAAMAVDALRGAGLDPSYVVGGELGSTGANAGWGAGEWIVIEADESDRSLLKFDPEIAVLTSAELDHPTTYSSRLDLEATFRDFLGRARVDVVWDRPELLALCRSDGVVARYDADDPVLTPAGA